MESKSYSESELKNSEVCRLLNEYPVKALWKAYLYRDTESNLFFETEKKVFEKCSSYINEERWKNAFSLYEALKMLNCESIKDLSVTESFLKDKISFIPDGFSNNAVSVSSMIEGTVTVLVDLGVKVKRGVGYNDKVIGSGFFIDKRGYIVTNHHVIASHVDPKYEGYSRLYVKLAKDSSLKIPAKVVGYDALLDLALLKTEVSPPYVFRLGSSDNLEIGDNIYAIGSPGGLDRTLTSGIVSAVNRNLFSVGEVLQIDAAVNAGNSGGPVIDKEGNVQAVVFAGIESFEGLNFAIPIEYLKSELNGLYSGGKLEHAWFAAFGEKGMVEVDSREISGIRILYLAPDSPFRDVGIGVGDLIYCVNKRKVENMSALQRELLSLQGESLVEVEYISSDKSRQTNIVYLGCRPENPSKWVYERDLLHNIVYPVLGMKLLPASSGKKTFVIDSVINGSIADEAGFSEKDAVDIKKVRVFEEEGYIAFEMVTKRKKSAYIQFSMTLASPLDSPCYF